MDNVSFRSAPEPTVSEPGPEPEINNQHVTSGEDDREPIEIREEGGGSVVLDALDISDTLSVLPEDDQVKVGEVKEYVMKMMESKGLSPTVLAFKKVLGEVKAEMGLDAEADPSVVLDRVAGVVRAWRNLSFVKDTAEKKRIFMRLSRMETSEDMNREVYKLMNDYQVWR